MRKPTPKPLTPRQGGSYVDCARTCWGEMPDWIAALAEACDRQHHHDPVARLLGCSPAAVWALIFNRYQAKHGRMEQRVRGALMKATVECPELGEISTAECLKQRQAKRTTANPHRLKMWHACRKCPNGGHHA